MNLYWHMYLGVGVLTFWVAIAVSVTCTGVVPVDLGYLTVDILGRPLFSEYYLNFKGGLAG